MTELIQHVKRFRLKWSVCLFHMHKQAGYPVYTLYIKKMYISTLHNPYSLSTYLPISLMELCNYGGVDYKPSDGWLSEDDEELPSRRSASLSSDISAFSSVTLLSTDELDRLLDEVRGLGDDTRQVKQVMYIYIFVMSKSFNLTM